MQRLYPLPAADVAAREAAAWPRRPRGSRPWVMLNMVASIDGAATVGGLSAGLSSRADRELFWALREAADVILVGARTANVERYRSADRAGARVAVVSGTLRVEADLPLFTEPSGSDASRDSSDGSDSDDDSSNSPAEFPMVFTTQRADPTKAALLGDRAEVLGLGDAEVDLAAALAELGRRGAAVVLCEGGPALNASLLAADLVDEINLTTSPLAVGGDAGRIVAGAPDDADAASAQRFELCQVLADADALFVRWQRSGTSPADG